MGRRAACARTRATQWTRRPALATYCAARQSCRTWSPACWRSRARALAPRRPPQQVTAGAAGGPGAWRAGAGRCGACETFAL